MSDEPTTLKWRANASFVFNPIGWDWPENKAYHNEAIKNVDPEFRQDTKSALLPSSSREDVLGIGAQFGGSLYPLQRYVGIGLLTSLNSAWSGNGDDLFFWDGALTAEADLAEIFRDKESLFTRVPVTLIPFVGAGWVYFDGESRSAQRYFNPQAVEGSAFIFTTGLELPFVVYRFSEEMNISIGPFGRYNYAILGELDQEHFGRNILGSPDYFTAGLQFSLNGTGRKATTPSRAEEPRPEPVRTERAIYRKPEEPFEFILAEIESKRKDIAKESDTFESGNDQLKMMPISNLAGRDIDVRDDDKGKNLSVNPAVYNEANIIEDLKKYYEEIGITGVKYNVPMQAHADMRGKQQANMALSERRNLSFQKALSAELNRRGLNSADFTFDTQGFGESMAFGYECQKSRCNDAPEIIQRLRSGNAVPTVSINITNEVEPSTPFFSADGKKAGSYSESAVKNGGYGTVRIGKKDYLIDFQALRRLEITLETESIPLFETSGADDPNIDEISSGDGVNLYKLSFANGYEEALENFIGAVKKYGNESEALTVVVAFAPKDGRDEDKIKKITKWFDAGAKARAQGKIVHTVYVTNDKIQEDTVILTTGSETDVSPENDDIRKEWSGMLKE